MQDNSEVILRLDVPHGPQKPLGLRLHELAQIPKEKFDPDAVMSLIDETIGGSKKTTNVHKGPVFELTTEELNDFAKVVDLFDRTVKAEDVVDLELYESLIVEALECIELRRSMIAETQQTTSESEREAQMLRRQAEQRAIFAETFKTMPNGNPAGREHRRRSVG